MLEIKHLKKSFSGSTPIRDINCVIQPGEVISIIGPSGTGKSTLLRCINRLETPTSGEILYNGQNILSPETDISEIRKHIGMVFQSFNLFPHLTVLQNIMLPQMQLLGRSKQQAYERAVELLKQVGLFDRADRYPDVLSGGQKQRIAIARTLAMDNDIILLDEPTSALDPAMVGEVEGVIRNLTKTGITMLIVTHEMRFARTVSSRIFFLSDGIIEEEGPPEQIFEHPKREKTRQFIFRIHELPIEIRSGNFDFYSCMTEIARFAEKNYLSRRVIDSICAVFEELVVIPMLPGMTEDDRIDIRLNCSENLDQVTMTVGSTLDFEPERDIDPVSMTIIRHHVSSLDILPVKNGERSRISAAFRKE